MFCYALVHALIPPANQDDAFKRREAPRRLLPKKFARRRKQPNRASLPSRGAFSGKQRFHGIENRLWLHHHAFTATKRTIVHGAMAIMREIPQIMDVCLDQVRFPRTPHDSVIERSSEEFRENCDEIKTHKRALQ